jgi:hypothetical protein
MSIKGDALEIGVTVAIAGGVLWYVSRKLSSGLSAAGSAIAGGASSAWNTATTPVLDPSIVGDTAASVGNGIVAAPANALDSISLGLIGGSGGTTGNGGIGAWLWNVVNGNAFAPSTAVNPQPIPLDFGNGTGNW